MDKIAGKMVIDLIIVQKASRGHPSLEANGIANQRVRQHDCSNQRLDVCDPWSKQIFDERRMIVEGTSFRGRKCQPESKIKIDGLECRSEWPETI